MRRARRAVALALALALVGAGCSDAHTPEEKAWADQGIDPSVTFVLTPPRLEDMVRALLATYKDTHDLPGPLLVATVDDHQAVTRIAEVESIGSPTIWFGPAWAVDSLTSDAEALLGIDPLAGVGRTRDLPRLPSLAELAGDGEASTGHCADTEPCAETTAEVFEAAGVTPDPTTTGLPDTLLDAVADEELDVALVPRSYGAARFPALVNLPLPEGEDGGLAQIVAGFGDGEVAPDLVDWIERGIGLLSFTIESESGIRQPASP